MRKLVAALIVAVLAFTVAGCSKKEAEPAATTDAAATTAAPAVAPSATATSTANDRSANDTRVAATAFPSFTTTITPAVFKEKLDAHRPMLIFYYDSAQDVTADMRKEIDAVMKDYRGLIDLVTFDIGGAATDPNTEAAAIYASELAISSTPYTLVVDRNGFITWRCKGFSERKLIGREVERATR